jgi:hypothetical protein
MVQYGSTTCWQQICEQCDEAILEECVDTYDCTDAPTCAADTGCADPMNCDTVCPTQAPNPPPHVYVGLSGCIDVFECRTPCEPTDCNGLAASCGDCQDNDGDGLVDIRDPDCTSSCDNDEGRIGLGIPGAVPDPCNPDCFFDDDGGSANDQCTWSYACDPEDPRACGYDESATVSGLSCAEMRSAQNTTCGAVCRPIVPNGCDCFGCCELPPRSGNFVYVGDECMAEDPSVCAPCTPVPSCENTCDDCEMCLGDSTAPCEPPACPNGVVPCGPSGGCPGGSFCVTGCCQPLP